MLNCIGDRLAERLQLLDCVLRVDAQRCRKLCAFNTIAFQFGVLESGERIRLIFLFKERALSLARFAVIHHEFEVWTIAIAVSANPNFASPHPNTVAIVLPYLQGKMRQNAFFLVGMSQTRKRTKMSSFT